MDWELDSPWILNRHNARRKTFANNWKSVFRIGIQIPHPKPKEITETLFISKIKLKVSISNFEQGLEKNKKFWNNFVCVVLLPFTKRNYLISLNFESDPHPNLRLLNIWNLVSWKPGAHIVFFHGGRGGKCWWCKYRAKLKNFLNLTFKFCKFWLDLLDRFG